MRNSGDLKDESEIVVDSLDFESNTRSQTSSRLVQWALQDIIREAKLSDKLVCGVHLAAEELENAYNEVVLCVLVVNSRVDLGTQINCQLIDAFCWDISIPVLKVNSSRKLKQLVGVNSLPPVHCLLVKDLGQKSRSLDTLVGYLRSTPGALLKIL